MLTTAGATIFTTGAKVRLICWVEVGTVSCASAGTADQRRHDQTNPRNPEPHRVHSLAIPDRGRGRANMVTKRAADKAALFA